MDESSSQRTSVTHTMAATLGPLAVRRVTTLKIDLAAAHQVSNGGAVPAAVVSHIYSREAALEENIQQLSRSLKPLG